MKTAGKLTGCGKTVCNAMLHGLPDCAKMIKNIIAFAQQTVIGNAHIVFLAEGCNFLECVFGINIGRVNVGSAFYTDRTAAHAVNAHEGGLFFVSECDHVKRIGMRKCFIFGVKNDFTGDRFQGFAYGTVGLMTFTCKSKRTVQDDLNALRLRVFFFEKLCRFYRSHGVRTGGAATDAI